MAGNVRVLNRDQGLIPKMIDVVFVYSFDFMRASQSMVRTVMCTPGALAAYRKSVVTEVLKEWMGQTFCGRPANIGEDRAMTNLILRQGFDVVFQQNARVYTEVPVRYLPLCKMYLRWARSNIRETIAMTRFIFKPFRRGAKLGARLNLILSWAVLTKFQVLLVLTWALIIWHPLAVSPHVVYAILLSSSLPATIYAWKFGRLSSLFAYAYGLFFFTGLFWITPYALMTPHKSGWLTRTLPTSRRKEMRHGKTLLSGQAIIPGSPPRTPCADLPPAPSAGTGGRVFFHPFISGQAQQGPARPFFLVHCDEYG